MKSLILPSTPAPERPDLLGTFNTLRDQQGLSGLQSQLTQIRQAKLNLRSQFNKYSTQVSGGVVESIAERKISKEGQAIQEQLNSLASDEVAIVDQLNSANQIVSTIMDLQQKDYQNASQEYDRQYQQNIALFDAVRGIEQQELTAEEKKQDNARANLQILANQLSTGDLNLEDDPALLAQINSLELKAGMPIGTIASIKDRNPKADIVSTTTRTDQLGNSFTDVIVRDKVTGQLKLESVFRGKERIPGTGGGTGTRITPSGTLEIGGLDSTSTDYILQVMRNSKGGKLADAESVKSFSKGLNVIGQLQDLASNINNETTGPIVGILRSNNPYDVKAQLIKAQLMSIVPNLARGVYGEVGVLTDTDIANYSKTLPNLKSIEDVRTAILGMTVTTVQRSLENQIETLAGFGRDVSGLENIYTRVKNTADQLNTQFNPDQGNNLSDDALEQEFQNLGAGGSTQQQTSSGGIFDFLTKPAETVKKGVVKTIFDFIF